MRSRRCADRQPNGRAPFRSTQLICPAGQGTIVETELQSLRRGVLEVSATLGRHDVTRVELPQDLSWTCLALAFRVREICKPHAELDSLLANVPTSHSAFRALIREALRLLDRCQLADAAQAHAP